MKHSSRPRKTANLSDSIDRQLNMYAVAASAAGVGLLALAQPAEAKIVYAPTHKVIGKNNSYLLALNHGTPDFIIRNSYCRYSETCNSSWRSQLSVAAARDIGRSGNQVEGTTGNVYLAAALKRGARIPNTGKFGRAARMALQCSGACNGSHTGTRTSGPWVNVTNRYLGLKFKIDGKFHYGWARLDVKVLRKQRQIIATLTGYAYETIPNKAIIAGQTKGPDDNTSEEPKASLTAPASRPATLGLLALGSRRLSIRRREELPGVLR
jgi:hypothetical protein